MWERVRRVRAALNTLLVLVLAGAQPLAFSGRSQFLASIVTSNATLCTLAVVLSAATVAHAGLGSRRVPCSLRLKHVLFVSWQWLLCRLGAECLCSQCRPNPRQSVRPSLHQVEKAMPWITLFTSALSCSMACVAATAPKIKFAALLYAVHPLRFGGQSLNYLHQQPAITHHVHRDLVCTSAIPAAALQQQEA